MLKQPLVVADARLLAKYMRTECINHRYVYDEPMQVGAGAPHCGKRCERVHSGWRAAAADICLPSLALARNPMVLRLAVMLLRVAATATNPPGPRQRHSETLDAVNSEVRHTQKWLSTAATLSFCVVAVAAVTNNVARS